MYKIVRIINGKSNPLVDSITNKDKVLSNKKSAELLARILYSKTKLAYNWVVVNHPKFLFLFIPLI